MVRLDLTAVAEISNVSTAYFLRNLFIWGSVEVNYVLPFDDAVNNWPANVNYGKLVHEHQDLQNIRLVVPKVDDELTWRCLSN